MGRLTTDSARGGTGSSTDRGEAGKHQAEHCGGGQHLCVQVPISQGLSTANPIPNVALSHLLDTSESLTNPMTPPGEQDRARDTELDQWVHGLPKEKKDGKKKTQLPETPKTAEEMWQQSVIGDYLAKYRVRHTDSLFRLMLL